VDGTVRFFANVWADDAPRSVSLLLAGATLPMQVALGSAARGTWAVDVPAAPTCRTYAFVLVDAADTSWRYPASGSFSTYGEGTCTEGP
jgi:1,4-alpha-glucan branching enzyme